ncbi:9381_t:CDS:2, partial [Cetraspora pellucida]
KLEQDITVKDALIKQKNEEIGDKLTSDLITKLDNLTKSVDTDGKIKLDNTKITEIKTLVEEIKNKGAKADLTETNNKIDEVKTKVEGIKSGVKEMTTKQLKKAIQKDLEELKEILPLEEGLLPDEDDEET